MAPCPAEFEVRIGSLATSARASVLFVAMDLGHALANRSVLRKTTYNVLVRRLCQTKKAQNVAGDHSRALRWSAASFHTIKVRTMARR